MTIARFMHYYSYKYHEVLQLKAETFHFLVDCMIKAKANDDLELVDVTMMPQLKDRARNKKINELVKRAETKQQLEDRSITTDQLQVGNIEDFIKD